MSPLVQLSLRGVPLEPEQIERVSAALPRLQALKLADGMYWQQLGRSEVSSDSEDLESDSDSDSDMSE